jgi:apolipoprotein N-acyltransferase
VPDDFDAGDEFTVFDLSHDRGRIAPLICFEDTIGELTRRFVLNGADLLVTVTNDGWFKESAGSHQHLANAIFRCVETRRPMARAANTGVTCFVNDLGRVTQILRDERGSTFEEGTLAGEVNIATDPPLTFYVRHGELFAKICTAIAIAVLLFRIATNLAPRRL